MAKIETMLKLNPDACSLLDDELDEDDNDDSSSGMEDISKNEHTRSIENVSMVDSTEKANH